MKRGFFLLGEQIYNLSRAVWQKLRYSFRCSPEFQLFAEEAERINQQRARFRSNSSTCASKKTYIAHWDKIPHFIQKKSHFENPTF